MDMGIDEFVFSVFILLILLSVFILSLLHRKIGGLKGIGIAFLLTVSGLGSIIILMLLIGPVITGTVVLCTACGVIPAVCVYHIINYLRLKRSGGSSEGYMLHWGFSSRMNPNDCPVIIYVSNDGEQRSFEFKNNIFLTEKRCLRGVNIIYDIMRPSRAYVEKYSFMSYMLGLIVFAPLLVLAAMFSVQTLNMQ